MWKFSIALCQIEFFIDTFSQVVQYLNCYTSPVFSTQMLKFKNVHKSMEKV